MTGPLLRATAYVLQAYLVTAAAVPKAWTVIATQQHGTWRWMPVENALMSPETAWALQKHDLIFMATRRLSSASVLMVRAR